MTRDYAKKPQKKRRKPKKTSAPGWVWLLAGVLLGVLMMTLIELAKMPAEEVKQAITKTSGQNTKTSHKPRFDFYTLLRETEVIVPDFPDSERELRDAPSDNVFLLQAGSFKNAREADSLRIRLLLLNLTANIETFSPNSGETWHRVLVGPFDNNSQVASARGKLASNRIDSLLLKRKK